MTDSDIVSSSSRFLGNRANLTLINDDEALRLARFAEIGMLAGSAIHELRQPLFAVKAVAQLLLDHVDSSVRERARLIVEQAERMERITNEYRTFLSSSPKGHAEIDLCAVAAEAASLVSHHLKRHGAAPSLVLTQVPRVLGNHAELVHAVVNLVANAADAVDEGGGGSVEIATGLNDEEAYIAVSDGGAGLTSEAAADLFHRPVTTKAADRGTGLGLFICARIAENHRGRIEYRRLLPRTDRPFRTQFRLVIPCNIPASPL